MERSPVSLKTFESITLQNSSVLALGNLIKDYSTNSGVRAKLSVFWMILALSYVLGFPTLMSAMTGYSGTSWYSQGPNGLPSPRRLIMGLFQQPVSPISRLQMAVRFSGHRFDS
jgi:hypothetical protein